MKPEHLLSAVFPAAAEEIRWLSQRFDEVRYGGSRAAEPDATAGCRP